MQPPEQWLGWTVVGLGDFALNQILPSFAICTRSRLVALVKRAAGYMAHVCGRWRVAAH